LAKQKGGQSRVLMSIKAEIKQRPTQKPVKIVNADNWVEICKAQDIGNVKKILGGDRK